MLLDRVDNILFQKKCDIVKMWAVKAKLIFFFITQEKLCLSDPKHAAFNEPNDSWGYAVTFLQSIICGFMSDSATQSTVK